MVANAAPFITYKNLHINAFSRFLLMLYSTLCPANAQAIDKHENNISAQSTNS